MTRLAVDNGVPRYLAILLGIGVCAAFGAGQRRADHQMQLPPFIVTLGTLNIAFALTHIYSEDQTVTDVPDPMTFLGNTFTVGGTDSPTARS